jgi:HlyD family secretion protein
MAEIYKKSMDFIKRRRTPIAAVILIAAAGAAAFFFWGNKASASDYITAKVERTNVEVTVSATGTVQAVTTVQVGSQVSGTVLWLGADFNSDVKRGQVIAKLDPSIFQAQVDNARAQVDNAQANVANAEAAVQAAQTEITNQQANLMASQANLEVARVQRDDAIALAKRYQEIKDVIAGREIEAAQANANAAAARYQQAAAQVNQVRASNASAKAKVDQAKASLAQSKAQLAQSRAQLEQSSANLDHSIIASPIDGVVISRNVDVGQTVAASLQAPTLFTIANDLTKMQVLASIDEADVGQIKQGIQANFTVDAFPNQPFTGEITQLRLNAQTLQNVVTYSAVIEVANPELKLRPGMTANITIPVARSENVLTVPNAALRFKPTLSEKEEQELRAKQEERRKQREAERGQGGQAAEPSTAQPQQPAQGQEGQGQGREGRGRRDGQSGQAGQQGQAATPQGQQGQAGPGGGRRDGQVVWVLTGAKTIEPRFVRTGLTNGRLTEILGGDLHEGDTIVIGQNGGDTGNRQQPTSPFGQRPPGGGGPRGR